MGKKFIKFVNKSFLHNDMNVPGSGGLTFVPEHPLKYGTKMFLCFLKFFPFC